MYRFEDYQESAAVLREKLAGFEPEVLIILGSGLGFLAELPEDAIRIPYCEVPHMKVSTAMGHVGQFVAGTLSGKKVLMMQGRLHVYEGHTAEEAAYAVRVAKLLGAHSMIVTNAAGGINVDYKPGDLMIISDFIKLAHPNPLIGPNLDEFGDRFPDMTYMFPKEYRELFKAIAAEQGTTVREGVYFYTTGPQYETPAEIRAMRIMGADAVGMSTVHECLVANHCRMKILGVSLITNMAAGILDQPLSGEEVLAAGENAKGHFSRMILTFLERM
ncbi:MAG: purine-nucleoside phosphorylase [Clostridia bacterium]|nr:purine-nucleoside phosphorylase [Clostridia bacterium]